MVESICENAIESAKRFTERYASEVECQPALQAALSLREIECAAVARNKRAVSLRKKIAYIYQRFHAIGKHAEVNGLAKIQTQIRRGQSGIEGGHYGNRIHWLPTIGRAPLRACALQLAGYAGRNHFRAARAEIGNSVLKRCRCGHCVHGQGIAQSKGKAELEIIIDLAAHLGQHPIR